MIENELLCDAWLVVSEDFVGSNSRGSIFRQRVLASFHARKNFAPDDMDVIHECNVKLMSHR